MKKWESSSECCLTELKRSSFGFSEGKSKKEEQKKISLGSSVWGNGSLHHRPRSSWTCGSSHHIAPPTLVLPPPLLHWLIPSISLSLWLLHPIEFCLTLMIRFVDVECPLSSRPSFLVSPNLFFFFLSFTFSCYSKTQTVSFSLIQSLALDYHSSQRGLLIELYALTACSFPFSSTRTLVDDVIFDHRTTGGPLELASSNPFVSTNV